MLSIHSFTLGPAVTNCYLVADTVTKKAVVIDPAWDGDVIVKAAQEHGWEIQAIWITHAHFDHFGGAAVVANSTTPPLKVALHPDDMPLWKSKGGAAWFGVDFDPGPVPSVEVSHGMQVSVGEHDFEVRHAPGHSPGHVMFYSAEENVLFSGDVIFRGSIGRTDLPGGDYDTLIASIESQVFTLPDHVRVLNGHGPETTVGREKKENPFFV